MIPRAAPSGAALVFCESFFSYIFWRSQLMLRRSFLKSASLAALATTTHHGWALPAGVPRIAYGGISIESSTYGHIRASMGDFTILRGNEADDNARFAFLKKRYPTRSEE